MAKMLFETATNTYTSDKVIGQGGAGTVFSVLDPEGGRYALKRLNPASSLKRRRFKNELSFCQQEQHPNVIRVLDSGVVFEAKETLPFYVMPFYDCTLRTVIKEGVPDARVLPLFDQILSGVEAAHLKKVFHRDLKPENILYDRRADCLVVADFGIAHFEEDQLLTARETGTGAASRRRTCECLGTATTNVSIVSHEPIVFGVRADPDPHHGVCG